METHCLNCNTAYTGNFCPQCGQKRDVHRFTLSSVLHDIPHSVFHVDKGFLFTFKALLYRPGPAIREFIKGRRVNYFKPFAYLLLMSTINTLISHAVDTYRHRVVVMNPHMLYPKIAEFFYHYPALMLCLLVPLLSFWSWIFNRQSGYNYWENFVLNLYVVAQLNLFFILSRLIYLFTGFMFQKATPMLACFIFYMALTYTAFFPNGKNVWTTVQRALMYILIIPTFLTGLSLAGFITQWW